MFFDITDTNRNSLASSIMNEILTSKQLHPTQLIESLQPFVDKVTQLANILGLDLCDHPMDHIALRVNHDALAKALHLAWSQYGKVISQASINGRPIVVLHLDEALVTQQGKIECLELPYPAPNKHYAIESWEHIEIVIPSKATTAVDYLDDLTARFPKLAQILPRLDKFDIKMKLSSPKGEKERLVNPTLAFKQGHICLKLHPHPLKAIVESEHSSLV